MLKQFSFALLLATIAGAAQGQEWGDLDGTFVLKGGSPTAKKLEITKDPEFCGKHNLVDESVVVGKDGALANVFVYLFDTAKPKIHPDYEKVAKADVVIDNQNCRFNPHAQAIRVGQTLVLGNKDPIGHNTKADFFKNAPFNDLIPATGQVKKTFTEAETTPTPFSCSIHPWMNANVLIREDPYFAVSDKDGKILIKNLPVGEHSFKVWSNKFVSNVTVNGKPPMTPWTRGTVKFTIKAGMNSLGKVEVNPEVKP